MQFVTLTKDNKVGTILLNRGKVNALNDRAVEELNEAFQKFADDPEIRSVVLTGKGKFFSFGFDIPGFLSYSKEDFTRYLTNFTDLYTRLFLFPKPVIASLNGHAVAGGCMLATACDHRIMVRGNAKISLNEIGFGSSVFAGSVEMLKFWVGGRNAQKVLYSGEMYSAEDALHMGLIDETASEEDLPLQAEKLAQEFAQKDMNAFRSIKMLLRHPVAAQMREREAESIQEFVEIWYSPDTWNRLHSIRIHG
jgi:3,2-trans-enoyl-CoA isomerase